MNAHTVVRHIDVREVECPSCHTSGLLCIAGEICECITCAGSGWLPCEEVEPDARRYAAPGQPAA